MNPCSAGRFWIIGVGPGDPELLTLKAVRLVRQADVIYHAGPEDNRGRALAIVQAYLRPEQHVRRLLTAAMGEITVDHYRPAVEQIATDCRQGRQVVFLTEGDPTLYSTAAPVWRLLARLHPDLALEIVPGVSSVTAAAARVGWPLAQKDEPLLLVPAGYHAAHLHSWIETFPGVCLLKPASVLPQVVSLLQEFGPRREAVYVEEVGTAREWLTHQLAEAADRHTYFSLVLVRRAEEEMVPPPSRSTGRLTLVGLGPGDPALLTRQALAALHEADVLIGYESYLQRLTLLGLTAEIRGYPIGAEVERAQQSLELARSGRRVALVSSGDAGVYGMASLVLEMAAASPELDITIVPGVTAATAAASLLGAPLGHDFACISLSDLLTPWAVIEQRLIAAAQADFVVALYNPVSQRRDWQLGRARALLLQHRRPETPVGLVDKAYRPGTRVWHTTLADLTPTGIGMETLVIIGNSQTRLVNGRLVTPRGYPGSGAASAPPPTPSITPAGRTILEQSFAIIERELGEHRGPPWAFAVVRRMIHASADFDFAHTLRYSSDFEEAVRQAFRRQAPIVTDTEMVLTGIRSILAPLSWLTLACHLNDQQTQMLAEQTGLTRSAAAIRVAARRYATPLLVIGNAPTALDEALRLVEEGWRPAAILGLPVGFVGVEEAKERLLQQTRVPYLTCVGRKGGSAVAAAALNALADWVLSFS